MGLAIKTIATELSTLCSAGHESKKLAGEDK